MQVSAHHDLDSAAQRVLLLLARQSIEHTLKTGLPLHVAIGAYPERLRERGACFVSLHIGDRLRGCVGSLEARRPLIADAADNACAAAFRDPRFMPMSEGEWPGVDISLSVLSPPLPLIVRNEREAIEALRPGEDGLLLEEGLRRATFLPLVWHQLASPERFLKELKRKAGLDENHWSPQLRLYRYRAEEFSESGLAGSPSD